MPHSGRLGGSGRSFNNTHQDRRQTQGRHEHYKSSKFTGVPDFSNADGSRIDVTSSAVNSSRGRAAAQVVLGMFVFAAAGSLVSASTGSKSSSGSKPSSSGDGNKGSKPSSPAKGVIVSEGFSHAKGSQGFEGNLAKLKELPRKSKPSSSGAGSKSVSSAKYGVRAPEGFSYSKGVQSLDGNLAKVKELPKRTSRPVFTSPRLYSSSAVNTCSEPPVSSAKGGIQKSGVQFDDFQNKGFSYSKGNQGFEGENFAENLAKIDIVQRYLGIEKPSAISAELKLKATATAPSAEATTTSAEAEATAMATTTSAETTTTAPSANEVWTVEASYTIEIDQNQGDKCNFANAIFTLPGSSYVDYQGNLVNAPEGFFKHLPRSLAVLPHYNNAFPSRNGIYTYAVPDHISSILERYPDVMEVPEVVEESFKSRDENGRSISDILCVVDPEGDFAVRAFRPDTIRHSDKAGVPSIFYALMASEATFYDLMNKLAMEDKSVEMPVMLESQLNDKKDLFDNPDNTLASIASSLHRDVNEAYNAHDVSFSGSYTRTTEGDVDELYTLPFPCACESLVSSSGFQACTKDYVDLVADMKKSGILFRKSVKLPDGGERSFKKVGSYTAVSPGSEDESSYEVPVITKANAKATSDYFKDNPKAFDKWMEIKERIDHDGIADGAAVDARPGYEGFLGYLDNEHEALSERSALEGLRGNFDKNLAIMKKALGITVENQS